MVAVGAVAMVDMVDMVAMERAKRSSLDHSEDLMQIMVDGEDVDGGNYAT